MAETIKAFNIYQAYEFLQIDHQDDPLPTKFINLDEFPELISMEFLDMIEGKGVIFGRTIEEPGENVNQIQTVVTNHTIKGGKKWESVYLGVWADDRFKTIQGSKSKIKKECVDAVREAVQNTGRSAHVIVGQNLVEHSRIQAEIDYKPSPKQEQGTYEFYW